MKECLLGDLLDVNRGMSLSGEFYATEGNLVRLTCGNFDYNNNCFKENHSKDDIYFTGTVKPQFIMDKDDLITPLTEQAIGLLGSTAFVPEGGKYIQSQDVAKITCKEGKLDKNYAFYLISSNGVKKQLSACAQQTKIRHTSPDAIKACKVFVHDYPTQKKIGKFFRTIDEKIALNQQINRNLEELARLIYDYWFVQFDFPDKNGKPYKSSGGKMVWNEKLKRDIPAGWQTAKVRDVILPIERGISYSSDEITDPNGTPMINLACFDKKGNYRTGEFKYFTGKYKNEDKVYPFDMLIACTDLTQKADIIGTPIFAPTECPFYVFSMDLVKITPIRSNDKQFLYYYLKHPAFHHYIKPFASGTTVKHLRVDGLLDYPIFMPDESVRDAFAEVMEPIRQKIADNTSHGVELSKMRDYLLPLLMNGQVSVKSSNRSK